MVFRTSAAALLAALALPAPALAAAAAPCTPQPERPQVAVKTPTTTLSLRVADTARTREVGLMCVLELPARSGMIFVFPGGNAPHEFWMKNTLIPLDMVWVDRSGIVTSLAANVPATTLDTPDADIPRREGRGVYVIELPAGEAARDGLVPGARLDVRRVGTAKD